MYNYDPSERMAIYNIYDARNCLSELVERALNGEEIVIARRNEPAVRLTAVSPPEKPKREFGRHRHLGRVTDAFFDPLPDDVTGAMG